MNLVVDSGAVAPIQPTRSIPSGIAHFDELHRDRADPWQVQTSWYERRKRALMLGMLPNERYGVVFEPGCSIGGNTKALAARADKLIAADFSTPALQQARSHLAGERHVQFECWDVPDAWPDEPLDLVVISEFAYYLSPARLDLLWDAVMGSLAPNGQVLLCHWRSPLDDAWLGGDEVHARARSSLCLQHVAWHCEEAFRIDVWNAGEARQ